jgi:hypothetical protein
VSIFVSAPGTTIKEADVSMFPRTYITPTIQSGDQQSSAAMFVAADSVCKFAPCSDAIDPFATLRGARAE